MSNFQETVIPKDRSVVFNRIMYGLFVALAAYFFATSRPGEAMSNLGIALIFDPFDQKVMWSRRPMYQRMWLLLHLAGLLSLLAYLALGYVAG